MFEKHLPRKKAPIKRPKTQATGSQVKDSMVECYALSFQSNVYSPACSSKKKKKGQKSV